MRITNPMITNRMLLNINRNARNVDRLYTQLATGKQVIFPSDDPILAGRVVKFRTSVTEAEQYQRNTSQGLSWMEITEGAYKNVTNITSRIRELLIQGSSDENTFADRKTIAKDVEQLVKQLGSEMNVSYAGRYVFSGYRTDQPPVIQKDDAAADFTITQHFTGSNIEVTDLLKPITGGTGNEEYEYLEGVSQLKLAYTGMDTPTTVEAKEANGNTTSFTLLPPIDSIDEITTPIADTAVYYVKDTGNLIFGKTVAEAIQQDGVTLDVEYTKTGLKKDELNPTVYFDCVDNTTGKVYNMNEQIMEYEFGTMTRININSLAKDVYTDKFYADLVDFCDVFSSMPTNTVEELTAGSPGMTEAEVKELYQTQQDQLRKMSQQRFNSMLGQLDSHNAVVMREQTDLGSRMSRLELIERRLEDDRVNYKKLLSDNEDVDYTEVAMEMNLAESVYQAALQVSAKVLQLSLADYIR